MRECWSAPIRGSAGAASREGARHDLTPLLLPRALLPLLTLGRLDFPASNFYSLRREGEEGGGKGTRGGCRRRDAPALLSSEAAMDCLTSL